MGGKDMGWTVWGSSADGDGSFFFLKSPDLPWATTSRLFNGCRGVFPAGKAAGACS
jgi:hypothetical protein